MIDEAFLLRLVCLPRVQLHGLEVAVLGFGMNLPAFAGLLISVVPLLTVTMPNSIVIKVYISVIESLRICVLSKK